MSLTETHDKQVVQLPTKSVTTAMANRYGMEPAPFEATLRATVVPKDCSREQFAAFLVVAREYNLNPLTKEIFAFPTRGGGIQPIVSVDGWANLINSNPTCDGFEFEDEKSEKGELVSITCKMYRKDRSHPVTATEYMSECRRNTDTWKQWPRRMLRHKALIQAARYAFGFAGIVDQDEYERWNSEARIEQKQTRLRPPAPPPAPALPKPVVVVQEVEDEALADPQGYLNHIEEQLACVNDKQSIEEIWQAYEPNESRLPEAIQQRAAKLFADAAQRVGGEE